MLASNNVLSPATGRPIITPSQDMVLGCYYMTVNNPNATKGEGRYFGSMEDAILAYEQQEIYLHAYVWVRFDGPVETDEPDDTPVKETPPEYGVVTKEYKWRRVREDEEGNLLSQYLKTTAGRIIFNKTIHDALAS